MQNLLLIERLWAPLLYIVLIPYEYLLVSRLVGGSGDQDSTVPPADAALAEETPDAKRDVTQTNGRGRHQLPERRAGTVVCPGSWFAIPGAPAQAVAWVITPHSVASRFNRPIASPPLPSSSGRYSIPLRNTDHPTFISLKTAPYRLRSRDLCTPAPVSWTFSCSILNASPPDASRKNLSPNWQGSEFRLLQQEGGNQVLEQMRSN